MSDRFLNLADPESRALNAGASVLIVPMRPQPPETGSNGGKLRRIVASTLGRGYDANYFGDRPRFIGLAPFAPGDILHGREAWGVAGARLVDPCLNYRADGAQRPIHRNPDDRDLWLVNGSDMNIWGSTLVRIREGWVGAQQMPAWAIRHKYPVKSISAIRVSEIGEEDAVKWLTPAVTIAGWIASAQMFWQSRYPKLPWESWAWKVEMDRKESK